MNPSHWNVTRILLADMFRRNWVILIFGFVLAISPPALILGALKAKGALNVDDPAMIVIHVTFTQIMGMCFGVGVLQVAGWPSRLFLLPLSNRAIMLFQMVPATVLVIGQTILSGWILNALFGLNWPTLGNALAFGMVFATFQSFLTLFQKSVLMLPTLGSTLVLEALWVKSRHGPIFSLPTHYWTMVTPVECGLIGTVMAFCYALGMYGITRARCGKEIQTGLIVYLSRAFSNRIGRKAKVFRNGIEAQSWFEWYQKGVVFPIIVAIIVPATAVRWLFTDSRFHDLLETLQVEGWMMSAAAMIGGMILGNMRTSDSSFAMSPFLGTKPLATTSWSRLLLATAFRSLAWGILIWLTVYLLVLGGSELTGENLPKKPFVWWHFPGQILAAWTAITFGLCLSLSGKLVYPKILGAIYFGWLITALFVRGLAPAWFTDYFTVSTLSGCGIALFILTLWVWGLALRRRMVANSQAIMACLVVASLTAIAGWQLAHEAIPSEGSRIHLFLLVSGLLSLVVFPFAAAPLALASNRAR
jgi:hypothetical protein